MNPFSRWPPCDPGLHGTNGARASAVLPGRSRRSRARKAERESAKEGGRRASEPASEREENQKDSSPPLSLSLSLSFPSSFATSVRFRRRPLQRKHGKEWLVARAPERSSRSLQFQLSEGTKGLAFILGFVIEPLKTKSEKCAVEYKTGRGDHVVERVNFVNAWLLTNSRAYYFLCSQVLRKANELDNNFPPSQKMAICLYRTRLKGGG